MDSFAIVILAAGLGKRMGSALPKVVISTREKPLIQHLLTNISGCKNAEKVVIVTGHRRDLVEKSVLEGARGKNGKEYYKTGNILFAFQEKQIGTGDAVKSALPLLKDFSGTVLILYGDAPLITSSTLSRFLTAHEQSRATVSFISFRAPLPNNYGRVVRDEKGEVSKIVEARDCSADEIKIDEVNSGIYLVDSSFLAPAVNGLKNENAQGEYYLTDILEQAAREGQRITAMLLEDSSEVLGVNTNHDLMQVNEAIIMKKINELVEAGVRFDDPESVFIDSDAQVAAGVRFGPNVQVLGNSVIEGGVTFEGSAYVKNSVIKANSEIKFCVRIEDSVVGESNHIGPFAHLRPGTESAGGVKIGNFVETKKARLAKGAKASHLTYLGDCTVGSETNIGAGTITCNYDGYRKSETAIGEGVFIGSNTSLVAPVKVGDGATIGAGSVITKDVEKDSLAVSRAQQVSKPGWSKSRRLKNS